MKRKLSVRMVRKLMGFFFDEDYTAAFNYCEKKKISPWEMAYILHNMDNRTADHLHSRIMVRRGIIANGKRF